MSTRQVLTRNLVFELPSVVGRRAAPLIVGLALAACSSGGDSTTQPPPTPSIDISVSPTAVSVSQGQSGTATATVNRSNFTGSVTLSAEGLPTGVTASFNPPSLANGATSSVITFSAAVGAPPTTLIPLSARFVRAAGAAAAPNNTSSSNASLTIRATGSGVTDKTASLALTVVVAGGYTLSATPASLSIAQGGSGSSTINIARSGGFDGSVALSVTGAPAGMTATLNPTSTTSNSSSFAITAASNTAPGIYALTVTGSTAGLANQSTTVSVTVTALTSSSIQYCATSTPIWFGYQNDGASWVNVTAGANNTFTFNATPRLAIAAVTKTTIGPNVMYGLTVAYTTPAEIGALATASCAPRAGTKQLSGSIAGLGQSDEGEVQMAGSFGSAYGFSTNFTLSNVPDGALDLLAARVPYSNLNALIANALILRRGVNLTSGSTIPVLDFGASEAFAPATATLTLTGIGSDVAFAEVMFTTGNGTAASTTMLNSIGASSTIAGVPTAQLAAGDIHQLYVSASPSGSDDARAVITYFRNIGATTVDLKAALNTPTITVPHATPYAQPSAQVASQSDYASGVLASYSQISTMRSASVLVTAGYLGGAPATWSVTLPDLSAAPSFDVTWGLLPNTYTTWDVEAFGGPLSAVLASASADGTVLTYAKRAGSLTTPASSVRSPVVVSASRAPTRAVSQQPPSLIRRAPVGILVKR